MSHEQRRNDDQASRSSATLARSPVGRPFKLTESTIEDGCREIAISGELDLAVAARLQEALAACEGEQVLISLEACQFIDSTGLAVILDANREGRSRILLHSPHDQVLRILEVTGLTGNGLVFADREQAISAVVRA